MTHRLPIVLLSVLLAATAAGPLQARTLVVAPGSTRSSVAAAVAEAAGGDTVRVEAGTYHEHGITVTAPIVLMGSGGPVLDGDHAGEIVTIRSDGVTLSGFVLRNVGTSFMEDRAAIRLRRVRHCVVENNTLEDAFFGIYGENTGDSVIRGNVIRGRAQREATSGNGIHLWYCRGITVDGNDVRGHRDGIYFEFVEDSRVVGNTSRGNLRYGLHFMFSQRDDYEGNAFIENGAGVAVMYSGNVVIARNRFERNRGVASYGLLLKEIKDSRVEENLFSRNTVALYSEGSNRLAVEGNRFIDNGYGVKIMANSMDNTFTGNDFIGNTFDVTTNSRQNFNRFSGNYWSDYRGYDLDRDGVGDVPHHPVRLFALLVERQPPGIILMQSLFVHMVDTAERALPVFTPQTLVDDAPRMHRAAGTDASARSRPAAKRRPS